MTMPIDDDGITLDEAGEAFLKKLLPADGKDTDAKKPSDDAAGETETESDDHDADDDADESAERPDADDDEDGDDDKETAKKFADDGAYIKIKVGEEEHEVAVKDLGRLYGQESALTKKSMEVAERRKSLDNEAARNGAVLEAMLQRAQERYAPYAKIDFLALSRNPDISDEELTVLRQDALTAHEDVRFLTQEIDTFMGEISKRQHAELVERAAATIRELGDSPDKGGIEGWSDKLYDDIRSFAVTSGAPKEIINNLVDSWAIRLLHKAMLYDRGKSKVITTKVDKKPTKVVKTTTSPQASKLAAGDKSKNALKRLKTSGTTDDAAEALLARWADRDDD